MSNKPPSEMKANSEFTVAPYGITLEDIKQKKIFVLIGKSHRLANNVAKYISNVAYENKLHAKYVECPENFKHPIEQITILDELLTAPLKKKDRIHIIFTNSPYLIESLETVIRALYYHNLGLELNENFRNTFPHFEEMVNWDEIAVLECEDGKVRSVLEYICETNHENYSKITRINLDWETFSDSVNLVYAIAKWIYYDEDELFKTLHQQEIKRIAESQIDWIDFESKNNDEF